MPTLTYYEPGTALFESQVAGWPDNSLTGVIDTLDRLPDLTPTTETATTFVGDFRLFNLPSWQMVFSGTGFTYSSTGVPTGGVITGWQNYYDGELVSQIAGISVTVPTLDAWIETGNYALAAETVFPNDTITAPTGKDVINGWGGTNLAVLPDLVKEDQITGSPLTDATVVGPDISDTLTSIQRIQFVDGTLYYDSESPAAQTERMYEAALGRAPDPLGLTNWVSALNSGTSLDQVAADFIASAEFQGRYPGVSENATAFVTQLYANVLNRAPDPAGLAYWVGALQSGTQTQAQVLVGFSESAENQSDTAGSLVNGIWVANEQTASVARLYYATLNRAPDANGLASWTTALQNGSLTLEQEAGDFMASSEFQQKYGTLSNSDFVTLLYENVLNRQPDSAGLGAWTNALASGTTRADVVLGFSQSTEFQTDMVPKIEAGGIILA